MLLVAFLIGFAAAWLLRDNTFKSLREQLSALQKEKTSLREQLQAHVIQLSAGLHTSECELRGTNLSGPTVTLTVRIVTAAQTGEMAPRLVSSGR